jgi:hypothetical protein
MDQLDSHFYKPAALNKRPSATLCPLSTTVRIETYICISVRQEYGETVPFRNDGGCRKLSTRQYVFVDRAVFHDNQKALVRVCDELNVL